MTIGIAPMAEALDDAAFRLTGCRRKYSVTPSYSVERLELIVHRAVQQGVEILLLPEMSVPESELSRVRASVLTAARAFAQEKQQPPPLRYVFAGVSGDPLPGTGLHRNFVVLLDSMGREVARQEKLFGWDLHPGHLKMYGLYERLGLEQAEPKSGLLLENIEAAKTLVLIDLPDMGRILNFICADMSYNLPGDWMLEQFGVDWLHAPIMDRSIDAIDDGPVIGGRWITQRAHRAAHCGQARVMVTNSVSMTHMYNEAIGAERPEDVIEYCGIGLFVDASRHQATHHRIAVPLSSPAPILAVVKWGQSWHRLKST